MELHLQVVNFDPAMEICNRCGMYVCMYKMYVCMCVCVSYVCIYIYLYVCTYVCRWYMYVSVCVYVLTNNVPSNHEFRI